MQQLMLPLIPEGVTRISGMVCVHRGEDRWTYFLGLHPIYVHGAGDKHMFHIVTSILSV